MLRRTGETRISKAVRVLLSCTVLLMFSAMLRSYHDPDAPHDMHPGLESCRHIKDLARHKFDGEYLIRSDLVAQLASMWMQSDCSRYTALLSDSRGQAAAGASQERSRADKARSARESRQSQPNRPTFDSDDASHDFTGSAVHNPVLVADLPIASVGGLTSMHVPEAPTVSSRSDDVPSPPPRALG